jgi:hypothetical protein
MGSFMEQEEFLVKLLFFKRVMKCLKDHQCSLCGRTILTGSSYFRSWCQWPYTAPDLKYCEQCFDVRLDRPTTLSTEQKLDR